MNEYHQITPERRYTIYRLKKDEYPQRKIAQIIDVHTSTLSRELKRNTNGLIRQFFPHKFDFRKITNADIERVIGLLNNRPRKTLGFQTPNQVFLTGT